MKADGKRPEEMKSEDARILAFLTGKEDSKSDDTPSKPRRKRAPRKSRKDRYDFPVETRNRYDGTHEGLRERALQEAIERGVDPSTVKATGPGSFEFTIP